MDGCIVCGIVSGSLSAYVVYEDRDIVCFLDANPISAGHVLVGPKAHISGFSGLSDALVSKIFCIGKRVASAYERAPSIDGVSILQNSGSFNELGHFHLHVFPRHRGDGFSWKRSDASLRAAGGFAEVQRNVVQALREV